MEKTIMATAKKEYLTPQASVVELDIKGSLLASVSGNGDYNINYGGQGDDDEYGD